MNKSELECGLVIRTAIELSVANETLYEDMEVIFKETKKESVFQEDEFMSIICVEFLKHLLELKNEIKDRDKTIKYIYNEFKEGMKKYE